MTLATIRIATLFAIIALLSVYVVAECSSSCSSIDVGGCKTYTESSDEFCACHSGRAGADCDTTFDSETCTPPAATSMATDFVPTLKNMDFNNDKLRIELSSPYVANRFATTIGISSASPNNSACFYPGPGWQKTNDDANCADSFTSALTWSSISDVCGWNFVDNDEDYYIYKADLTIQHEDLIVFPVRAPENHTRVTVHSYPIEVKFPKHVSLQATMTAHASVTVQTALISQVVSSLEQKATVVFLTNVIYPYKLTAASVVLIEGMNITIEEDTGATSCPDNAESTCTQRWFVTISFLNTPETCEVTGTYHFDYTIICQESAGEGNCAIDDDSKDVAVELALKSENMCAETGTSLDISAELSSYRDAARQEISDEFFAGTISYWTLIAHSPNATIDDVKLHSVTLASENPQFTPFTYTAAGEAPDAAFQITSDGSGEDHVEFQIQLVPAVGFTLLDDTSYDYTMTARLDVSYSGVNDVSNKRTITIAQKLNQKQVTAKRTFSVSNEPLEDAASTIVVMPIAFALLIFLAMF